MSELKDEPNLYRAFQSAAGRFGDLVAVKDEAVSLTFAELEVLAGRAGKALIALGVCKSDTIAIWAQNRWQWVVAGLGLQAAGGVLIPCGTRLRAREIAVNLTRAGTKIVFCDPAFGDYDFVTTLLEQDLPSLEHVVVFDDRPRSGKVIGWGEFLALGDGIGDRELEASIAAVGPQDLADLLFTSGTTGIPKGVPMTQRQSLVACQIQHEDINHFEVGDIFAVNFPFAHNAGYRAGWQVSLFYGVTIIPVRNYDPHYFLQLIDREKVTMLPAAPPVYQGILEHSDRLKYDLSSLRYASTGGTTVPMSLIERMQEMFGVNAVSTGYGLTEAAGSVTSTRRGDPARMIVETTGKVLSNLSVRILDADHKDVAPGEQGEVAVKGEQILHEYYNDPEATAKSFTLDGYFLTGDVGWFDDDGNLRITDRLKDMYLVGGFNTYPAEIEKYLCSLPGVARAAVIGVDDARLGQVGKAFIVPMPGETLEADPIIAACKRDIANYKVPRYLEFVDALPLNATGKIDKKQLREMA